MNSNRWLRYMPLVAAVSLLVPSAPAAAQRSSGDIGTQMEREYGVVESDTREGRRMNAQLDDVVERIVRGVNETSRQGDFRLRGAKILGGRSEKYDRAVNAFALPDGRIYVTLGLMRMIQNSPRAEDELAFVVGHEVTHVAERHSASQARKSLPVNIAAVLLGAATRNETLGTLGRYGAAAYSSSFSRKDEYEADQGGVRAMVRAGYDPNAAPVMLQRLKEQGGGQNRTLNGWFGSHPLTENRIERVREMIADSGAGRERNARDEDVESYRRERRR
jgi:beta-barrel assembly-enhancing protease